MPRHLPDSTHPAATTSEQATPTTQRCDGPHPRPRRRLYAAGTEQSDRRGPAHTSGAPPPATSHLAPPPGLIRTRPRALGAQRWRFASSALVLIERECARDLQGRVKGGDGLSLRVGDMCGGSFRVLGVGYFSLLHEPP